MCSYQEWLRYVRLFLVHGKFKEPDYKTNYIFVSVSVFEIPTSTDKDREGDLLHCVIFSAKGGKCKKKGG